MPDNGTWETICRIVTPNVRVPASATRGSCLAANVGRVTVAESGSEPTAPPRRPPTTHLLG